MDPAALVREVLGDHKAAGVEFEVAWARAGRGPSSVGAPCKRANGRSLSNGPSLPSRRRTRATASLRWLFSRVPWSGRAGGEARPARLQRWGLGGTVEGVATVMYVK